MEKMVQIPCAPDCDSSLQEWVDDISYPANRCLLLTVARMDDLYKGHDIMLRAMPLIAARVPHVRWVVVGDGKWRSYYEKMAHALGVQDRVHFLGTVSESERDKMLASCDVFVMVSRDRQIDGGGEGFGLVYLEANAFGKPVVAGRVAGALDAVVDGVTGLLVNPEDEFEVAEAVIALLTNPARAAQLGQQGRDRVQQNFTWDRTAAAVEEVLYKVARPISVQQ
jgi:phosphatidylinositol alpha-1,6-mannosyltransferase